MIDVDSNEKCKVNERQLVWASTGLRFRGTWSATANYVNDDVVVRNGSSYIAIAASRNVQPPNASKWALMASAGRDGTNGADGEDATMVVAGQACEPPYRVAGFNPEGTIICDEPSDSDGDTFVVDLWNTNPSLTNLDCDDSDATIHPNATEIANDGIDQDCDGADTVLDCEDGNAYTLDYVVGDQCAHDLQSADVDGDGSPADNAVGGSPDCDDTEPSINPYAYDTPGDGIDQDCDGMDALEDPQV